MSIVFTLAFSVDVDNWCVQQYFATFTRVGISVISKIKVMALDAEALCQHPKNEKGMSEKCNMEENFC